MSEKPSYYAIIPAKVRYDEDLCPNAKLLYGEITCLAEKEGYCWASNMYFAKLYGVQLTTISEWIKQLTEKGHVETVIDREGGNIRKIYLPEALREKPKTSSGKAEDPSSGKAEHINTRININKEKNMYSKDFEEFWDIYPRKDNKKGAYKKWIATKKREGKMDVVMQGAEVYANECKRKKTEKQYIKLPATFLGPDEHWREYAEKYKPPKIYEEKRDYQDYLAEQEAKEKKA